MKKNILTIIIMAIVLINTILTGVLIFTIVPTANKTNKLMTQVASIVNLELENPDGKSEIPVSDIASYNFADKLTINLKSTDGEPHYAVLYVSVSMNSKHDDYETLRPKVEENKIVVEEIVMEEFGKYTMSDIKNNSIKDSIKAEVLKRLQEYFQSDFIINVSFGNIVMQ